ncbi:universal stress protein [Actinomadura sp. NEAU-AAG7]|uniref:universal stress protein n=1 Tax=Actinomadura sp. NEAU-AAG7 TaxID=2839640 RepID=UPI001BE480FD|nr:universal stress protein [Actinomadura sp. NEAU-AAG7]MBT2212686.1 universal stress protein [Actinomadura sp. NEAU-AAG7]
MSARLLLAVEDSPAALAAARYAVELARTLHAGITAVAVVPNGALVATATATAGTFDVPNGDGPSHPPARTVLGHIERLAHLEEVRLQTVRRSGDVARRVLDEARRVGPDLIVLGRAENSASADRAVLAPWVTRVLESAHQPVLVVPAEWRPRGSRPARGPLGRPGS